MGVVGRIQIIFIGVAKVVLQGCQGCTESVACGTMDSVSPATASRNGRESGGKGMYKVGQCHEE